MTYITCSPDELYHFGVKGMKWGVRKSDKERAAEYRKRKAGKLEKKMNKLLAKNERKNGGTKEGQAAAKRIQSEYGKKMKAAMNMSMNDIKLEKMVKREKVRRCISVALAVASTAAIIAGAVSPIGRAVGAGIAGTKQFVADSHNLKADEFGVGEWIYTSRTAAIAGSIAKQLNNVSAEGKEWKHIKWSWV